MFNKRSWKLYIGEFVWIFLFLFLTLSLLAPVFLKNGYEDIGMKIHSIYRVSCHQRVERSMFLFGEESFIAFYSIDELQGKGAIPVRNDRLPHPLDEEIFGYPFVGNDEVGFKVALCIRDISIYTSILITGLIYFLYIRKKKQVVKFDWRFLIILMIPMAIDGTFQLVSEVLRWDWVPDAYFASIWKRIITGALFGVGFALLIFPNLKESSELWYNEAENGDDAPNPKKPQFNLKKRLEEKNRQ